MGYRWKEGIIPEGYLEGEERKNDDGSGDTERRYWYQNPETNKREYQTEWTKYKEGDATPEIEGKYRYETSGQKWKEHETENILALRHKACGHLQGEARKVCEQKFASVAVQRGVAQYAIGGEVSLMEQPNVENYNFVDDVPVEEGAEMLATADEILTPEEEGILTEVFQQYPEMEEILDKVSMALTESEPVAEGAISGPGTGTSDSIDAKLSDGEFVFTAKATQHIGVDKLRKMMDKAENEADEAMFRQESKQVLAGVENEEYFLGGLLSMLQENHRNYKEPEEESYRGVLRDSSGNAVTDGSGEVIRTRYPEDNIPQQKSNSIETWAAIMNRAKDRAASVAYSSEEDERPNSTFIFGEGFVPNQEAIVTEPPPPQDVPLPPLDTIPVPEPQGYDYGFSFDNKRYNKGGLLASEY